VPRSVRTFLPVVGQPAALAAAFEDDPQRWLPAARRVGSDTWTLTLRAGALARTVSAVIGRPWRAGSTRWRTLTWDPIADDGDATAVDRLLPSLDGELGLHIEPSGRTTLVLGARYQPPGGAFGDAVDAVALRRLARLTVERFLEEVSARLAAEALLIGDDPAILRDAEHERGPTAITP
jgi:hypothetical protein